MVEAPEVDAEGDDGSVGSRLEDFDDVVQGCCVSCLCEEGGHQGCCQSLELHRNCVFWFVWLIGRFVCMSFRNFDFRLRLVK